MTWNQACHEAIRSRRFVALGRFSATEAAIDKCRQILADECVDAGQAMEELSIEATKLLGIQQILLQEEQALRTYNDGSELWFLVHAGSLYCDTAPFVPADMPELQTA